MKRYAYLWITLAFFLFSLAQVLETYSMDRARNAIKALIDLSPTEAKVKRWVIVTIVLSDDADGQSVSAIQCWLRR